MFTNAGTKVSERQDIVGTATDTQPKKNTHYREKWLKKMAFLESISAQTNAALLLHDISDNRYLYMSDRKKILGNYSPTDFTSETGMDFSFGNIHPEQRSAALLTHLKIISYCFEQLHGCLNTVIGNVTFLYKRKSGEYLQVLQKSMVVETDENGYPLLYLHYLFDISHLVRPSVGLIITSPDETLIWTYSTPKKCLEQVNLLSSQEKRILILLAKGKHSKEIGDMLFVSNHTVDTHRRNLLKKTNCIDTTALISFAKMTGLI